MGKSKEKLIEQKVTQDINQKSTHQPSC